MALRTPAGVRFMLIVNLKSDRTTVDNFRYKGKKEVILLPFDALLAVRGIITNQ